MNKYEKLILNGLIDSYEKSISYVGLNKKNQNIFFNVNKRSLKDYFNEDGNHYYEINDSCIELEDKDFINIKWKNNKKNHIIEKLILNKSNVDKIYNYIGRKEKKEKYGDILEVLNKYKLNNEVSDSFIIYVEEKIKGNKSLKQYFDIDNKVELEEILKGLQAILSNSEEIFLRELSIKLYNNSKRLEMLEGKIKKIILEFSANGDELKEVEEVFSEFNILKNPSFVYFKGVSEFNINNNKINLKSFPSGIGISSLDIKDIEFLENKHVEKVITIENLTSYNKFNSKGSLVIYLGGYHNKARRELLCKIYNKYKSSEFFHLGDIDAGGFKILNHLRKSTEIPFKALKMDTDTLLKYKEYAKTLTVNDRKELSRIYELDEYEEFKSVIEVMIKEGIKLEQEIIC